MFEQEIVVRILLHVELLYAAVEKVLEVVDIQAFTGRNKDAIVAKSCHPRVLQLVERHIFARSGREVVGVFFGPLVSVHFVEHHESGFVGTAQIAERLVNHLNLFFEIGVRHVDYVHQQVGFAHLVECTLERVNQVGRQFTDKAHRIGQEGRLSMITLRTVVSSVAKSLFSANTSVLARRLMSVDLPTLV